MKRLIFLLPLFLLTGLFSCSTESKKATEDTEIKADTLQISFAKGFKILQAKDAYIVQILNPENRREIEQEFYLYTKNARIQSKKDAINIQIPIQKNIALSSTHIGMINALGRSQTIVGVSGGPYLCDENLKTRLEQGKLKSVQDIAQANFEEYLGLHPDVIFSSSFTKDAPILEKLKQANIPVFNNYDWRETTPLGRAEWIKVLGIFFDEYEKANAFFLQEVKDYTALKEAATKVYFHPTVLSGYYYGGVFNAPAGESYQAQLYKDAGAHYVFAQQAGTGSLDLSMEEVVTQFRDVDYLLNVSGNTKAEIEKAFEKYSLFEAFQGDGLYNYTANNNCFWENAAHQPHLLLADYIAIFHPEILSRDSLNFYKNIQ
ncbi:iron complex transport system substrate-binding protein [Lishizhenia tianjinensis]|uniref:Iron complex transport system substrate-binding protein n=1 Tax=Lishizhenia tianjinensis TaxID=477690 RepID=A0A1I6YYT8_9FLAO|nr:ABC transporter substrate-binding protein [Lishizhenia tianjinensis]SFT55498.1 iron complex transport system substrate-binding protein [Lishizhenia tianjinensis]